MKSADRVKVNFDKLPNYLARDSSNPDGVEGTVTSIDNSGEKNDFKILVTWDNGVDNAYDKSHLIII
ncbi:MAG: hypothetical protein ACJAV0_000431 [Shewanella sp.]|jgi:hypothetical protein